MYICIKLLIYKYKYICITWWYIYIYIYIHIDFITLKRTSCEPSALPAAGRLFSFSVAASPSCRAMGAAAAAGTAGCTLAGAAGCMLAGAAGSMLAGAAGLMGGRMGGLMGGMGPAGPCAMGMVAGVWASSWHGHHRGRRRVMHGHHGGSGHGGRCCRCSGHGGGCCRCSGMVAVHLLFLIPPWQV